MPSASVPNGARADDAWRGALATVPRTDERASVQFRRPCAQKGFSLMIVVISSQANGSVFAS